MTGFRISEGLKTLVNDFQNRANPDGDRKIGTATVLLQE
jgi:hypothetical protein